MGQESRVLPRLAEAYLADLERALDGVDDRAEVVHSVREHIEEALSSVPEGDRSRVTPDVLKQIGPVERLAQLEERNVGTQATARSGGVPPLALALPAAVVALVGWINPFIGAVLAAILLAIGIFTLVRYSHASIQRMFLVLSVVFSGGTLLYTLFLILFVLSFREPVLVPEPSLLPGVPAG